MSKKSNNKSGMSMKTKWIITGILCVLAVLTVVVVAADGCEREVDGGVNAQTAKVCTAAGANVLVAGSAFFKAADKAAFVQAVK